MRYNIHSDDTWHRQYLASSKLKPQLLKPYIQSVNSKIMSHFHYIYQEVH